MIRCADCSNFHADKIGDGSGIGRCIVYSSCKAKGYQERELKTLLIELGNAQDNHIFWPGGLKDRVCKYYKEKKL